MPSPNQRKYTRDDKLRVAAEYVIKGTFAATSRATGVPDRTIMGWTHNNDEIWLECLEIAQEAYRKELPGKLSAIADLAVKAMLEKLGGDISAIQLNHITTALGVSIDKMQILANRPTSISAKAEDIEERLKRNAETLRRTAQAKAETKEHIKVA